MAVQFRLSNLVPRELTIESVSEDADTIIVRAKASVPSRSAARDRRRIAIVPCGQHEPL